MQVYNVRDRQAGSDSHPLFHARQTLDDGAQSAYGVACTHEARTVVELTLSGQRLLLCCAECGELLGVTQPTVA